jgi:two-component system KDP operon response regulator KdpE
VPTTTTWKPHRTPRRHWPQPPDAVILDLGLPDVDGTHVIEKLRAWSRAPIIVLSGRADPDPSDKVSALDAGADDYVTKPFSMDELLARLRTALRRVTGGPVATTFTIGHHQIDLAAHTITPRDGGTGMAGALVRLTPTEWALLEILLRNAGILIPARQLLRDVWGPKYQDETHYLRFYLARLRSKLEPDPSHPRYLLTEPGMGYRYEP